MPWVPPLCCRRDAGAFTAGFEEGVPPEAAAAAAAAAGPPAPSPAMLLAADSLQQLLRALAQHLDAVVFRDVWKAVALAVNYALYNEVATEALFSAQVSGGGAAACLLVWGTRQGHTAAMAAGLQFVLTCTRECRCRGGTEAVVSLTPAGRGPA